MLQASGNAKPFDKHSGFDIYLDGCRFLPSHCTVARVNYKVMTSRPPWAMVGDQHYAVADSKSPVLSPVYNHRTEYHAGTPLHASKKSLATKVHCTAHSQHRVL